MLFKLGSCGANDRVVCKTLHALRWIEVLVLARDTQVPCGRGSGRRRSCWGAALVLLVVITDVNSLQPLLPNVQLSRINFSGQALGASIRGISFADLEKTFAPAIGVVIDGVFLGTNTGANIDFDDLESIEVLRGPQGTLFGRNTIGGTISVRHTRPTGELGG